MSVIKHRTENNELTLRYTVCTVQTPVSRAAMRLLNLSDQIHRLACKLASRDLPKRIGPVAWAAWGAEMPYKGEHLVLTWTSGMLRLYRSPDGTPASATRWYLGSPGISWLVVYCLRRWVDGDRGAPNWVAERSYLGPFGSYASARAQLDALFGKGEERPEWSRIVKMTGERW